MLHLTIILPNLCDCECNTGLLETTFRSKIADAGLSFQQYSFPQLENKEKFHRFLHRQ